jgi:hypothetical protein
MSAVGVLDLPCIFPFPVYLGSSAWSGRIGLSAAQGFEVWTRAEEPAGVAECDDGSALWDERRPDPKIVKGIFPVRGYHRGLQGCWAAMRLCVDLGAPVPPKAAAYLDLVRKRTREVLRCFSAPTRLVQDNKEHGPALAAMCAVPPDVLHKILVLAGLEMERSIRVK